MYDERYLHKIWHEMALAYGERMFTIVRRSSNRDDESCHAHVCVKGKKKASDDH